MSTFFSGTDTATLKEEGNDRNNFVSLIVNNAGNYTAAITRRSKTKKVLESTTFEFFCEGERRDVKEVSKEAQDIEWFYLKIEKEGENYSFPDMAARLEEIKKAKEEEKNRKVQTPVYQGNYNPNIPNFFGVNPNNKKKEEPTQKTLFDKDTPFEEMTDIPYGKVTFDKATIRALVLQLITGSIIISNDSKIDTIKWCKSMPSLYQKRFGNGKEGMDTFELWADTYTEFLVWYATDTKLEELGFDEAEICAICAHDIIEELSKLPENDYINGYIEALQKFLKL
jgi:hypothetical protein